MTDSESGRRRAPRVPFAMEVALRGPYGITQGRCHTLDPETMFVETEHPCSEGDTLLVKFVLPGEGRAIIGEARVTDRQVSQRAGMWWLWLSFVSLEPADRELIRRHALRQQSGARAAAGETPDEPLPSRAPPPSREVARTPARGQAGSAPPAAASQALPPPGAALPPAGARLAAPTPAAPPVKIADRSKRKPAGPRFDSQPFVSFEIRFHNGQDFYNEYIENISKGGIFVRTEVDVPANTHVRVRLQLPGSSSPCYLEGRVVWRRGGPQRGLGIQFTAMDEAVRRQIEDHVEQMLNSKPLTLEMWKTWD